MSQRQLRVLRLMGWRFSATRDAWVHRIGRGRIGPVFVDHLSVPDDVEPDTSIYEALRAARQPQVVVPPEERHPLPRRAAELPPPTAMPQAGDRPKVAVEVQLDPASPPRTVIVDGRPPNRGTDPHQLSKGGVVVSLRKRRASA